MIGNNKDTNENLHNAFAYSSKYGVHIQLGKAPDVSEIVILSIITAAATTSAALNGLKHITINYIGPGLQSAASYTWNTAMPAVGSATKYVTTKYALPAAQGLFSYGYNWYCQATSPEVVFTTTPANPTAEVGIEQANESQDALVSIGLTAGEPHSMEEKTTTLRAATQADELKEQQAVNTNLQEVTLQGLASQEKAVGA